MIFYLLIIAHSINLVVHYLFGDETTFINLSIIFPMILLNSNKNPMQSVRIILVEMESKVDSVINYFLIVF